MCTVWDYTPNSLQRLMHSGKASALQLSVQADLAETGRTLRRVGKSLEAEEARLKQAAEAAAEREAAAAAAATELAAAQRRALEKEAALERLHADVWSKVKAEARMLPLLNSGRSVQGTL